MTVTLLQFINFYFLEAFLLNFHDLKFHLHSHYHFDQHHLEPEKHKNVK